MKTPFAALTAAALLVTLTAGGCYKSDWENEKKRADGLQGEVDKLKGDLGKAQAAAQNTETVLNAMRQQGTALYTFIDGKNIGSDGILLVNEGGRYFFVKHGLRVRGVNSVRYANGALADGPIALKRESAPEKNYVNGNVKGGKADGEWTWHDSAGKPTHRQVFANGKQVSVEAITVAKDGKVGYKKLDKAAADKFFNDRKMVFVNIPEFSWSL